MKFPLVCLTALAVLLAGSVVRAEKKLFRWKLEKGQTFDLVLEQTTKQKVTTGDNSVEIPNSMSMKMTWEVTDLDDNKVASITQTVQEIKMTMTVPGLGKVEYDSADKADPTGLAKSIADILKPMVGAQFKQKMTDRGQISDVELPEKMLKAFEGNPLLKQFFSNENFGKMVAQSSPTMPEEAVDENHEWSVKAGAKTPLGEMTVSTLYEYIGEKQEGDHTLDQFDADITVSFSGKGDNELGAKVTITRQDNSGKLMFNNVTGAFASSTIQQNIDMEVTVGAQTIVQSMNSNVTLKMEPATKTNDE